MKTYLRELVDTALKATEAAAQAAEAAAHAAETATKLAAVLAAVAAEEDQAMEEGRPAAPPSKAIGRALNALGYSPQFAEGDEEAPAPASAPVRTPSAVQPPPPVPAAAALATPTPLETSAPTEPLAAPPTPMPSRVSPPERRGTSGPARGAPPIDIGAGRERTAAQPRDAARPSVAPRAGGEGEPALEDYSWTAFWGWARKLGYESKGGIEELIGRPMTNLSPAEVRDLMRAKRGEE